MYKKRHKILLFIFFTVIIFLFVFCFFNMKINLFSNNVVQAVSSDIKIDFDVVGNKETSKNKLYNVVVPDNGFEEWNRYTWNNNINFSDNIIEISGDIEDVNMVKVFISKELDNIKIKDAIKMYEMAAKDGKYSKKIKEKFNNINLYYYQRYNNIDTRKSYQFVCEKNGFIFYIEGNFRIGEEEYFKRIIRQIIVSIEEKNKTV